MMRIAVTGGSGFLGSHVADALSEHGYDVTVIDVKPSPYLRPDQRMVLASVLDVDAVAKVVEGCDCVYHLAAIADIDDAINRPRETLSVNLMGTLNMLEAARAASVSRFVFASSIYVYSNQGSFYRTSKQAAEMLVHDYDERFGLPYTILRFGSLYGPRADDSNAVHRMLRQALKEGRISYGGTGQEVREYIHVADAAAASVNVLADEFKNSIVHLTGRERMKTGEMLDMIREIMGNRIDIELNNGNRTGHYMQTPYSYTPKLGSKLVSNTYIDLGLGLLNCLEYLDAEMREQSAELEQGGAP